MFKRATVHFSIGGQYYKDNPIIYEYMPDKMLKEPRNVSIDLKQNIARFVKIELEFSNVWLSVSEITFSSVIAQGSFQNEVPPTKVLKETSTQRNVLNKIKPSLRENDKLSDYPRLNTKTPEGKKIRIISNFYRVY